ncbi:MAG: peroxidase-related enzyme [Planctomycetota bacterium]|nr:peroxidase-related enzyme [Planctomycetota bacterium]
MAYIRTIHAADATPELAEIYRRVANPDGTSDEVMLVHSLSPESLRAHFELYVTAMHRPSPLSKAERELVGAHVSRLNGCLYCATHHTAGLRRLLPEDRRGIADAKDFTKAPGLTERERAMLAYAEKLTVTPGRIGEQDVEPLRQAGLDDRAILDLAQVVAYFCYANRIVNGLGAKLESFPPGQHPAVE